MPKYPKRSKVACKARASDFASLEGAIQASTRRAYEHDLTSFWAWAQAKGLAKAPRYPVPLEWVRSYFRENLEGLKPALVAKIAKLGNGVTGRPLTVKTLRRRLTSLSVEHNLRGVTNPCSDSGLHLLMRRASRMKGDAGKRHHGPITADVLRRLLATCGRDMRGTRDRALLLVGFAGGGRRRSELSALTVEDLEPVKNGYVAKLSKHKTEHMTGEVLTFPILGEAAKALDRWLKAADLDSGAVFRGIHRDGCIRKSLGPQAINRIVQRIATAAGYPQGSFGAHSLRSGFITQAAREGIALAEAMAISGHRSLLVAYRYYRQGDVLVNRAARLLGR